ncbi:hypothetical protein FUAX_47380 (plasmid) [Fulvitalea axinellae]|uniref:Uncharacterized protein n=1 Tax=Fulvitalea axinellae TaxID=1182444 RepID=A0AAU9CJL7_9BACT|nr:hypothetical protein FUAX_47380 [Fulvitalea axinellae]
MSIDFTEEERELVCEEIKVWKNEATKDRWALSRIIDIYDAILEKMSVSGPVSLEKMEKLEVMERLNATLLENPEMAHAKSALGKLA